MFMEDYLTCIQSAHIFISSTLVNNNHKNENLGALLKRPPSDFHTIEEGIWLPI